MARALWVFDNISYLMEAVPPVHPSSGGDELDTVHYILQSPMFLGKQKPWNWSENK